MSIALSIGNNLTTGGVFTSSAVNNTSVSNITDFVSVSGGGALSLLSTQTASSSSSIDFTSGLNSTYDSYIFKFINLHPSNDDMTMRFQGSTNGGSSYGINITSTYFVIRNNGITYFANRDNAQSTNTQTINMDLGNDNEDAVCGYMQLFGVADTTKVKHFVISGIDNSYSSNQSQHSYVGGYFNTTSAIDAIQFAFSTGTIDSGQIKLYGVS